MALFGSKDDKKKELLESGQKLAQQGDSTRALKEFQKAVDVDPSCLDCGLRWNG